MNRPTFVFKLEAGGHPGAVRFLSGLHVILEEGKKTSWVTITRTGSFTDPRYGRFEITEAMLLSMVKNFDARVYGQDIFLDVAHKPDDGAAAKIQKLSVEGGRLRAQVEWTPFGVDAVKSKGYAYLSAEFHENWQDNEKGEKHGPVLLGAALTVRPVIKRLDPVQLSEGSGNDVPTLLHPELQSKLLQELSTMWKLLLASLVANLSALKLAEPVVASLSGAAEKALAGVTDETAAKALIAAFEDSGKQLAAQIGDKAITLDIKVPQITTGLDAEAVRKLMAEETAKQAEAAKKLTETKAAKVKLLSDTINAAQGLDDEMKRQLAAEHADLVTAEMSDDQVKALAASQVKHGNDLVAARTLAAMGYKGPSGTPHITVDSTNQIKALQEEIDKRLYGNMPAHQRYALSEGQQVKANEAFVNQCLAMYDSANARRLQAEHKSIKLAAGDGIVSDVAIPAIFERTVIREALYQMVGLGLCDVGTDTFSSVIQLPYSYRDTTAAGVAQVRKYEKQAIARAGVRQELEEARPIPQKIAFEVSDELRYLASNGVINFDVLAENARNASRIIGEDTERLIFDEHLNAADQAFVTDVVNEAVHTADGTLKTFILANFPVVRPKKVYDLQGNQVGSTQYPLTVSVNSVNRPEYDGTGTQAAGIYWIPNYNLGELSFVNELGVPTAPTNTHAIVASYSYTTNVYKWDSDLPASTKIDEHYDTFLYRFGLRKAVIEDRSYMASLGIMSGTLRTQIEQARQFGANFKRNGTDLMLDGNLGRIKDVASFRSYAPGLAMGDQRVVIGERGTVRFRMLKPWAMGQLQDQKNADGRFTGQKEAYGDQYVVVHTPLLLKPAFTSMLVYSDDARIDRA